MRKFIKLMLWIYLYKIIIYGVFMVSGHETMDVLRLAQLAMPVWGFNDNFTSCFIAFWFTIPFWNILIKNMSKRQHLLLLLLLLSIYTLPANIPKFRISFNYVMWFGVIYVLASYIRLYPAKNDNRKLWGILSALSIIIASTSVLVLHYTAPGSENYLVADTNKLFSVVIAVTTFMWFKNLNIGYCRVINLIGASTFGVLLIHTNSNAMRQWLWEETVDCCGHFNLPFWHLVRHSFGYVLTIFFVCILIDRIRIRLIEEPFFRWYDKKPRFTRVFKLLTGN